MTTVSESFAADMRRLRKKFGEDLRHADWVKAEAEAEVANAEMRRAHPDWAAPNLPWEGIANTARATRAAGLPLTDRDREALRRFPDPKPSTWPMLSEEIAETDPARAKSARAAGGKVL